MIIGFNFTNMSIDRKNNLVKGMKVRYDLNIESVTEASIPLSTKQKGLDFNFKFIIDYDPDIANISISGTVSYMVEEKESKEIWDEWKKTKRLPKKVSMPVLNLILDKCNIKALELEQDLALPTHLPMPSVKVSGPGKDDEGAEQYIG